MEAESYPSLPDNRNITAFVSAKSLKKKFRYSGTTFTKGGGGLASLPLLLLRSSIKLVFFIHVCECFRFWIPVEWTRARRSFPLALSLLSRIGFLEQRKKALSLSLSLSPNFSKNSHSPRSTLSRLDSTQRASTMRSAQAAAQGKGESSTFPLSPRTQNSAMPDHNSIIPPIFSLSFFLWAELLLYLQWIRPF